MHRFEFTSDVTYFTYFIVYITFSFLDVHNSNFKPRAPSLFQSLYDISSFETQCPHYFVCYFPLTQKAKVLCARVAVYTREKALLFGLQQRTILLTTIIETIWKTQPSERPQLKKNSHISAPYGKRVNYQYFDIFYRHIHLNSNSKYIVCSFKYRPQSE